MAGVGEEGLMIQEHLDNFPFPCLLLIFLHSVLMTLKRNQFEGVMADGVPCMYVYVQCTYEQMYNVPS